MSSFQRPQTLFEVAVHIRDGGDPGHELKDFLHEFQEAPDIAKLIDAPPALSARVVDGLRLDAFLQALAVHLAVQIDHDPPKWTQPAIQLPDPWFASPGAALRNYLLMSSPAPFRSRNLFIDEDSLRVA